MTETGKLNLNNGVEMPSVGLGTWDLRGNECVDTVIAAISLGYRLIDTAHMYGNEREIGRALAQSSVPRSDCSLPPKPIKEATAIKKQIRESTLLWNGSDWITWIWFLSTNHTRKLLTCTGRWKNRCRPEKSEPLAFQILMSHGIRIL